MAPRGTSRKNRPLSVGQIQVHGVQLPQRAVGAVSRDNPGVIQDSGRDPQRAQGAFSRGGTGRWRSPHSEEGLLAKNRGQGEGTREIPDTAGRAKGRSVKV